MNKNYFKLLNIFVNYIEKTVKILLILEIQQKKKIVFEKS